MGGVVPMTPARIRELRRAGVLDGGRADAARIVLLDMVNRARKIAARHGASPDIVLADEIVFMLDPVMRDTDGGRALRWARARARRRTR